MKLGSRSLGDVSLHLTVVVVLSLLVVAFREVSSQASAGPSAHPAHCHACSTIPPGEVARFERFLVTNGYVEDTRTSD